MRRKEEVLQSIRHSQTLDEQLRINNELLLDIRSLLLTISTEDFFAPPQPVREEEPTFTVERDPNDPHLSTFNLSVRTINALKGKNIRYLSDLKGRTADELLKLRNFGNTGVVELRAFLKEHNIGFPDF
jgi:DNA-directed RNA polymerase alpha subunit